MCDYEILAVGGDKINACAQFQYRGYTISFSTILPNTPVMVFKGSYETTHNTVTEAIDWVDWLIR